MKTTLTALTLALGLATMAAPLAKAQDYDDWRYRSDYSDYRDYRHYDDDWRYEGRYEYRNCRYTSSYRCRPYYNTYWRDRDDYWRRGHRYCYWRYDRRICRWEY
jgi:hypothetical protein